MGQEERLVEGVAVGYRLIHDPVVMVREGARLREARPVFLVGRDDPFVDHVDVPFLLLDEGQSEAEALGELDQGVDDFRRDRMEEDGFPVHDCLGPVHRDDPVWLHVVIDAGFADQVGVSSRTEEELDSFGLDVLDCVDGAGRDAFAFMRIERLVDIAEDGFDFHG